MEQCLVCFSSFIINKALGWKWGWLLHREGTRLSETVLPALCYAVCSNKTQRSHHVTTWAEMARHTDVSVKFPICSRDVSISCLKLFCSWQFIRFSSRSQGWAIIKPHQAWRGNHSWAFFSHGVFSQWQAHWLCSLWVRLSPVLRRHTYAQIETGGDRRRVRHIGLVHLEQPSSVTHRPATISTYHAERYTWALSHSP